MTTDLVLWVALALVLYGLTKSTESISNIRQQRRNAGEEIKTYL